MMIFNCKSFILSLVLYFDVCVFVNIENKFVYGDCLKLNEFSRFWSFVQLQCPICYAMCAFLAFQSLKVFDELQ